MPNRAPRTAPLAGGSLRRLLVPSLVLLALGCNDFIPPEPVPTAAYTMSLSAPALTIQAGTSTPTTTVTLVRTNFTDPLSLAVDIGDGHGTMPPGVTAAFAPNPATGNNSVLTLTVDAAAAAGVYGLSVYGFVWERRNDAGSWIEAPLMLTVTPAPAPTYTLTLSVPALSIEQGALSAGMTVNLARTNFTGNVTLSVENLPTGVTASFNPGNPISGSYSDLWLTAAGDAPAGTFNDVLVRGAASGLTDRTAPLPLTLTAPPLPISLATIAGGLEHTCGLTPAGEAWCWGSNDGFRLGTVAGAPSDATNVPVLVDGGMTFSKIYAGGEHTCALSAAGAAFCWGENVSGQLGTGNATTSFAPTAVVGGFTFATLTTGFWHTCGLSAGGIARCWGTNYNHSVGDESSTDRSTPTLVAGGISFTAISAGDEHTCALSQAGAAWCWGWNEHGELGDGSLTNRSAPVPVVGGHVFESIVAGGPHTCGRKANGEVWCWGYGQSGALGDGAFLDRNVPVMVTGGNAFVSVTAGMENTCGLLESGLLKCWGVNVFGGVGDGTTTNRSTPVSLSGGHVFLKIAASGLGYHTCGLKAGGVPWCWGRNERGQLGDGSFLDRVVPTRVHPPVLAGGTGAAPPPPSRVRESPSRYQEGAAERGPRPARNRPAPRL